MTSMGGTRHPKSRRHLKDKSNNNKNNNNLLSTVLKQNHTRVHSVPSKPVDPIGDNSRVPISIINCFVVDLVCKINAMSRDQTLDVPSIAMALVLECILLDDIYHYKKLNAMDCYHTNVTNKDMDQHLIWLSNNLAIDSDLVNPLQSLMALSPNITHTSAVEPTPDAKASESGHNLHIEELIIENLWIQWTQWLQHLKTGSNMKFTIDGQQVCVGRALTILDTNLDVKTIGESALMSIELDQRVRRHQAIYYAKYKAHNSMRSVAIVMDQMDGVNRYLNTDYEWAAVATRLTDDGPSACVTLVIPSSQETRDLLGTLVSNLDIESIPDTGYILLIDLIGFAQH